MDTTHREIVVYWVGHQNETDLSVGWAEAERLCLRCAHMRKLQRCHIIPRSLGGDERPSNLECFYALGAIRKPLMLQTQILCGSGSGHTLLPFMVPIGKNAEFGSMNLYMVKSPSWASLTTKSSFKR